MIRAFLPLALLLAISTSVMAQQDFWKDVSTAPGMHRSDDEVVQIKTFRSIFVDLEAFKETLKKAPLEEEVMAGKRSTPLEISFPLPDSTEATFRVIRSSVMAPRLAAKYSSIQSFRLEGLEPGVSYGRFTFGVNGLSASLRTRQGEIFIDALFPNQDELYRVYFGRDVSFIDYSSKALSCGYSPEKFPEQPEYEGWEPERPVVSGRGGSDPVNMRVYTLALACTGEYAAKHGGTLESVLSSFNEGVSMLNEIYENELAIRFILSEDTEKLIWLDPQTDPFINADAGLALLNEINNAFTDEAGIPITSFDVGHLFTGNCNDVGGVAIRSSACNFDREKGVTCHSSSNVNTIVRRVMAHEIGHQFSASHSFTNCPPTPSAVVLGKAVEPGSGSTIMSYAGLCGNQNIINDNDAYFHVQSLEEIMTYTKTGTGRTCATLIEIENTDPVVTTQSTTGLVIPMNTPFQLDGSATDAEDQDLSYCWEQFDVGPLSTLGNPEGTTPLFRSFPPSTSSKRIFPRIESIVSGSSGVNEILPDYARDLTFRLSVRDNHPGGGSVIWDEVSFQSTDVAGPFVVLSPDTDRPTWEAGTYQEVVWEVAMTDRAPVNCKWVNILLSTDGGFTYPHTLATGLPNTGSAMVPVPALETVAARIKVEANDNIFFNISSQNFRISAPQTPGFTLIASRNNQDVCLPAEVNISMQTQAFLGYNEDVLFEIVDGLPIGASAEFSPANLKPGEATNLRIDIPDGNNTGQFPIRFRAFSPNLDTIEQTIYLDVISNDFSDIAIVGPENGATGIGLTTLLAWSGSVNAKSYEVELATNPSFQAPFLLSEDQVGSEANSVLPDVILEENTLHFWRLRPINSCGPGDYLPVQTFHTETLICTDFEATDTPVIIPGSGLPTKESVITVDFDGIISDLNIPIVTGNYQPVNSLRISLISPAGTEVILFDRDCGSTTDLSLGFDDEAPNEIICPPDDGIVFQPKDTLAAFIGESTKGDWTLRAKVIESGFGGVGSIGSWKLEFCASSTPIGPVLVTNDTLYVPPSQANPLTPNVLEAQDEDNGPDDLIFTLVQAPQAGTLFSLDQPLAVGGQFRQSTINGFNLNYLNENPNVLLDSFIFVVEDGTGGWISPKTFTIKVDDKATVDTDEPEVLGSLRLFPNPASSNFRLQLREPLEKQAQLALFDARGRLVKQQILRAGNMETDIGVSGLSRGLYFVQLRSGGEVISCRLVLQ